jgi:hypothetical protein
MAVNRKKKQSSQNIIVSVVTGNMRNSSMMVNVKAIAPQGRAGPECSRSLRLPDYKTIAT